MKELNQFEATEYFHKYAREDLCSQCKCQHFQRKYIGHGKYRNVCAKEHDCSWFVKSCEDYRSFALNTFQLLDLKSEKRRLEERE